MMQLEDKGPVPTDSDFEAFRRQSGVRIPEPVRWFLTNFANGGFPSGEPELRVFGLYGDDTVVIHGLLGVNQPDAALNLISTLETEPRLRRLLFLPIAYDPLGGRLYYVLRGPQKGEIRYMPWDELTMPRNLKSYSIAKDIRSFAKMLAEQMNFDGQDAG